MDNELAQSEEALVRNSARQIRFAFLLHAWNATLDYSENVLREAEQTDKLFNIFGAIEEEQTIGFSSRRENCCSKSRRSCNAVCPATCRFQRRCQERCHEKQKACDRMRDDSLPELGVKLEDVEGDQAVIKFVDKETLMKEKQSTDRGMSLVEHAVNKKRNGKQKEEAKKKLEGREGMQRKPKLEFHHGKCLNTKTDKYSKFDEQGVPTHDQAGEPLSGKLVKKLKKMYQQQEKLYNTAGPGASQAANGSTEQ
ncbi:hypothetical protein OS493_039823 [Desmophyllum pertusum]|uniref:Uncharacterized protein n=1 Tax=Desmophyllum pertusum TaxID=174260 RepID=A0A9W9ZUH2_9CNID|nr:hypothetical protein OS493_039823 [Desmophyllum pertusum]